MNAPETRLPPEARLHLGRWWFVRDDVFLARIGCALECFAVTVALTLLDDRCRRTGSDTRLVTFAATASFYGAFFSGWFALWRLARSPYPSFLEMHGRELRAIAISVFAWGFPCCSLVALMRLSSTPRAWVACLILVFGLFCTFGPGGTRRLKG